MGVANRKPKIAIIGTAGLPARYGGFETLADYLTSQLSDKIDFVVYCPATPIEQRLKSYNAAQLVYLPFKANGSQSIVYDIVSILLSVFSCDRLLILGSGGAVILPVLFLFRRKFVLNFGGLEWKRAKWGKLTRAYLKLTEFLGVRFSGKVIVDNQYFVDYVSSEYDKQSTLIEYGGDHCVEVKNCNDKIREQYPFLGEKYFLSVSRAQEDNNIHLLLEAFFGIENYKLVVVSNWDTSTYGRDLKSRYSGVANLVLLDAIYDLSVLNAIRSGCFVYIHSHSFCGTAPSLVEMMNLGKPVLSFDAPTNFETTERKALFFKTPEDIKELVQNTYSSDFMAIGVAMKEIAYRRYRWNIITNKYLEALSIQFQPHGSSPNNLRAFLATIPT